MADGMAEMADGMADGMEEWRNGGMARNGRNGGRMAKWSDGGNGYLPTWIFPPPKVPIGT
jgi:hypothetical protein